MLLVRRVLQAKFDDARNVAAAVEHSLDADAVFIRLIVNHEIRSADDPIAQGLVSGGPPGMRTGLGMLNKKLRGFLRQLKKSVSRTWALPNGDGGENVIQIALRPGADPGFH